MKRQAEIGKRVKEALETLQFNWGTRPRMFWGTGLANCAALSLGGAEITIAMTICGFLYHIGVIIDVDAVANMCPSKGCMEYILKEKGFLCLKLMRNNMRNVKYLCSGFYKANSRKGATAFVKVVAFGLA